MPQERDNPYPAVTKAEWDKAREGVPRETQAARLLLARAVPGIPHRPYLMGECDNAPILKAVAAMFGKVYSLVDQIDEANLNGKERERPTVDEWGRVIDANANLVDEMEDFT